MKQEAFVEAPMFNPTDLALYVAVLDVNLRRLGKTGELLVG